MAAKVGPRTSASSRARMRIVRGRAGGRRANAEGRTVLSSAYSIIPNRPSTLGARGARELRLEDGARRRRRRQQVRFWPRSAASFVRHGGLGATGGARRAHRQEGRRLRAGPPVGIDFDDGEDAEAPQDRPGGEHDRHAEQHTEQEGGEPTSIPPWRLGSAGGTRWRPCGRFGGAGGSRWKLCRRPGGAGGGGGARG